MSESEELCGCWVEVAGYETVCSRPVDHQGPCRPNVDELLGMMALYVNQALEIAEYIKTIPPPK